MSSALEIAAHEHLLSELAQLGLSIARDVQAKVAATDDTDEMVRLAEAYAKVGRCMRMSIALAMRLRRGEPLAQEAREDREPEPRAENDDFHEERPERLERESLYDRLPAGDLPTQIATVARMLGSAVRTLPEPVGQAYRARCQALAATAGAAALDLIASLPEAPSDRTTAGRPASASVVVLPRPRGPPS